MKVCVLMFHDNNISEYGDLNYKINKLYCEKYNFNIIFSNEKIYTDGRHIVWEKLTLILKHIEQYDYVIWIDSDAFFYIHLNIMDLIKQYTGKNFIFSKDIDWSHHDGNLINAGVFIVKNTKQSIEFLNKWAYDEDLFKNHQIPDYWREQSVLNYMYNTNMLNIQNDSACLNYGDFQHFFVNEYGGDLSKKTYILHLAGSSKEDRITASTNYYNKIK